MSKDELTAKLHILYEVVEVNNVGAVPANVAAETLRLINPGITSEQAEVIALDCDSRGKRLLNKEDFTRAALTCLQTTDVTDAISLVKDLTVRMRVAFRRRFLMYDAPVNVAPPSLLENAKMVSMFRELFDTAAHNSDRITRRAMKILMNCVLPEYSVDASNATKAALGDTETDHIGFFEFVMVVQPTTTRRCLSDMIALARRDFEDTINEFAPAPRGKSTATTVSESMLRSVAQPVDDGKGKSATDRLRQELQSYRMQEHFADQRAAETLNTRTMLGNVPRVPPPPPPPKVAADEELVLENTKLKMRNEDLERANNILVAENAALESRVKQLSATIVSGGARKIAPSMPRDDGSVSRSGSFSAGNMTEDSVLRRVADLEEDLRQARARLAIANETKELVALLRTSDNPHSVVRNFYPDESVFVGKHQYLREVSRSFDDEQSPISIVLGQYDLIIVGYQALYRQLRAKHESERAKAAFDPFEGARSIVPRGHASPSSMSVTPTRNRSSPSVRRSSPMKWRDLDREPTADMRGTRTLADPLLTDEERHTLRAKLAAQMRGTARYYVPAKRSPSMSSSHGGDAIRSVLTSQDALSRLQSLSGRAQRHRQLE